MAKPPVAKAPLKSNINVKPNVSKSTPVKAGDIGSNAQASKPPLKYGTNKKPQMPKSQGTPAPRPVPVSAPAPRVTVTTSDDMPTIDEETDSAAGQYLAKESPARVTTTRNANAGETSSSRKRRGSPATPRKNEDAKCGERKPSKIMARESTGEGPPLKSPRFKRNTNSNNNPAKKEVK